MRNWLLIAALLASTLTACGSNSGSHKTVVLKTSTQATPSDVTSASSGGSSTSSSSTAAPSSKATAAPKPIVVKATYVKPQKQLPTPSHKSPAVVLLPDTGNGSSAETEAQSLAKLGIGSLVVAGPSAAPTNASAFGAAVATTLAAVKRLKHEPGVDPNRVGIVGEGVGAHIGAVAIGREPGQVAAAVLADIGGVVVPSPKFAPDKWLQKADGIQLLFQRDLGKRAMTKAEVIKLMTVSPPGTLMQQYKSLGSAAQAARDTWIKQKLLAG